MLASLEYIPPRSSPILLSGGSSRSLRSEDFLNPERQPRTSALRINRHRFCWLMKQHLPAGTRARDGLADCGRLAAKFCVSVARTTAFGVLCLRPDRTPMSDVFGIVPRFFHARRSSVNKVGEPRRRARGIVGRDRRRTAPVLSIPGSTAPERIDGRPY
jgi:hypothetical protein